MPNLFIFLLVIFGRKIKSCAKERQHLQQNTEEQQNIIDKLVCCVHNTYAQYGKLGRYSEPL